MGGDRHDVFVHVSDALREGLAEGDRIRLVNRHGRMEGRVRIEDVKPGHVQVYWPECNPLLPNVWDPVSKEPDYNTRVDVERA
jgi:anaerobic selenocysteine-containing dehydrogenase